MKKLAILALALITSLNAACAARSDKTELIVFAAASMTETLEAIAVLYADIAPDVELVFNFDSSGTLRTQILEGADCGLFISAGQSQMDDLEKEGLLAENTRLDLLENRVALAVPEGNPAGITGFDVLAEAFAGGEILMAMGNADVPVGQYTQSILKYYGLDEAELAARGMITYGSNVKEVAAQIKEGSVDCGVIYHTDASAAGLTLADYANADMCGRVIYPAAVVEDSGAARDFLEYIRGGAAMAVFEAAGFSRP